MKLGNYSYYVREHDDGTRDLKKVPNKFAIQCIKHYVREPITELDRKFVDEGFIATYDKSLF